jgi:predicted exporter
LTDEASPQANPDEAGMRRVWAWAAWLWLALVVALAVQQIDFWRSPRLDSDVMALLPGEARDPLLSVANQHIVDGATRQVVVLIGSSDWSRSRAAAEAFSRSLLQSKVAKSRAESDSGLAAATDFYRPYRDRLLTAAQRERLQQGDISELSQAALADLYGPGIAGALTEWRADPLGFWPEWWQARMGQGIALRDGWPSISKDGVEWAILHFDAETPAFQLDGNAHIKNALDQAAEQARAIAPDARILRAGVPLHAEAAAVRASWEMNTIGWGSLLAVIALMWLAFLSIRPVLLVSLSLLIGTAAAVAVTVLVFGKIHLLTLVFGASLVGVAEDYGIHYFACRQGRDDLSPHGLMRHLLPGLVLALITSVLAYLALGIAPFPGLRQMAVFSAVGLAAAFATVACWFPWLDRGKRPISRFGLGIAASLATWPRFRVGSAGAWIFLGLLAVFTVTGLQRLQTRDDLRSLQNSPPELIAQQREIGQLLGLPSPAQFYLISGGSAEEVLQREEALKDRLDKLTGKQKLSSYSAISDWVPSIARQQANAELTAKTETAVLAQVSTVVGEPLSRPAFNAPALRIEDWLRQPISEPFRSRWLGRIDGHWASVLTLNGVGPTSDLSLLKAQAAGIEGVRWVDRTGEISELLAHYRIMMGQLLLAGLLAVGIALWWRYRRSSWRALLPTALAMAVSLAALGWLGEPFQLFTVLALLLLLGMGVDYGIFLIEHQGDGASWLAISLGAGSTLLAFGLLALSATPALHTFGLTMMFGEILVWLLSPFFRPAAETTDDVLQPHLFFAEATEKTDRPTPQESIEHAH